MKELSYRMWIIMLGIAVAMVIALSALHFNGRINANISGAPRLQKPTPTAPSSLLKKTIEKIDLNKFLSK